MKMFDTKLHVERRDWINYSHRNPRGSGYCEDQGSRQYLVKRYYIFGWLIWSSDVDSEDIPLALAIHQDIFGDCEFKSKFSEHIVNERMRNKGYL